MRVWSRSSLLLVGALALACSVTAHQDVVLTGSKEVDMLARSVDEEVSSR